MGVSYSDDWCLKEVMCVVEDEGQSCPRLSFKQLRGARVASYIALPTLVALAAGLKLGSSVVTRTDGRRPPRKKKSCFTSVKSEVGAWTTSLEKRHYVCFCFLLLLCASASTFTRIVRIVRIVQ
jgi:hypothetical protein